MSLRRIAAVAVVTAAACAAGPGAPAARADTVGSRVVAWGLAQVGTHERGTSNRGPGIDRWTRAMRLSVGRPWCGAFVHEAYRRAGIDLSPRLIDPAKVERDAAAGRRGMYAIAKADVRPGDLLLFALHSGSSAASHIAIVTSRPRGGSVRTVEGNVSNAVRRKTRGLRYAVMAVRVRR